MRKISQGSLVNGIANECMPPLEKIKLPFFPYICVTLKGTKVSTLQEASGRMTNVRDLLVHTKYHARTLHNIFRHKAMANFLAKNLHVKW